MRKLMWFTLGFGSACAWGAYSSNKYPLVIGVSAAVLLLVALIFGRKRKLLRPIALLMAGIAAGIGLFCAFDKLYLDNVRDTDGQIRVLTIRATDYSMETAYGYAVDGTVVLGDRGYAVRTYLDSGEEPLSLMPGDRIMGEFLLRMTVSADHEDPTHYRGNGIILQTYQRSEITRIPGRLEVLKDFPVILRQKILKLIEEIFPSDTCVFAKALLLGDTSDLSYETDTALKVSGIRHVVAVSGLHVSILFSIVYLLSGRRRVLTALLGIPAVLLFAAVAGFSASITRACIMQILMMTALLFEREYDPPTALSFAVLIMLAVNPLTILDMGFQLSVGCMAGIFLFAGRIREWILSDKCLGEAKGKGLKARLKRSFAGSVSVTLGAMTVTTPLCAWYFGTVSLIGTVTNLLTLWIVTYIFYGIILTCILGCFWLSAARMLAWLVSWAIRYVLFATQLLSKFPLAAVYTKSIYIAMWLIFCYVLIVVFLCIKKKRPTVFASCMALGLCAALLVSWTEPLLDNCRMTVLDVGQGQCILLQSRGRTYLVDCGGKGSKVTADEAAQTLLSQGVTHLDGMILTHYDADHSAGAANLLTWVDADAVFMPDSRDDNDVGSTVREKTAGAVILVSNTLELQFEKTLLTIYPPALTDSSNESSLCVLFQTEKCAILITGDRSGFGERMLLRSAEIPKVDVLIAGHHGSKNSACEELLQTVMPDTVMISVGADNPYGHPAVETIRRLEEFDCDIYRTDQHGTILYRR